jgi:hypothetical protein
MVVSAAGTTPGVRSGGSAQDRFTPNPININKMTEIARSRGMREAREKAVMNKSSGEDGLR